MKTSKILGALLLTCFAIALFGLIALPGCASSDKGPCCGIDAKPHYGKYHHECNAPCDHYAKCTCHTTCGSRCGKAPCQNPAQCPCPCPTAKAGKCPCPQADKCPCPHRKSISCQTQKCNVK